MISNLNSSSEAFLANMDRVQRRMQQAGSQTSSGKRVNVASDAPGEIDTILQLRTEQSRNTQIQENLAVAGSDANAADGALSSATKMMDRAVVLAAQGANFTLDASGRQSIAGEVQSIMEQMVALSRTTVQGRYIFGGDRDSTPPYDVDLTAANGVVRLSSAASTRRIEDSAGGTFAAAKSGMDVFDGRNADDTAAAGNVFAALNNLRLGLLTNDTAQITAASTSIQVASDHLNTVQAFYGTVQNRISNASSYCSDNDVQLTTELSQKEDADITQAAMVVTQGNIQLQAAFQMQAKMPRTTLFDFMG